MSFGFFEKYSILRDVEKTIEILYHPTPFLRRRYCVYTRHADFACTVYTRSSVYLMLLHAHQNRLPRFVFLKKHHLYRTRNRCSKVFYLFIRYSSTAFHDVLPTTVTCAILFTTARTLDRPKPLSFFVSDGFP